jgi:hypothetical protein
MYQYDNSVAGWQSMAIDGKSLAGLAGKAIGGWRPKRTRLEKLKLGRGTT